MAARKSYSYDRQVSVNGLVQHKGARFGRFRLRLRTLNALLAHLGNLAAIESKLLLQGHTLPCGVIDAGSELLPAASAL
jgi:hypothetical protein